MKLMVGAALMALTVTAPMQVAHASYAQAGDIFTFGSDENAPLVIEGNKLNLERVTGLTSDTSGGVGYIERATMRRQGNIVDVWVLIALPASTMLGDDAVDGVWASLRFDCAANTGQTRANAGVVASGKTLLRSNDSEAAEPIEGGTNFSDVAKIACGKNPNKGMPTFKSASDAIAATRK